MIPEDEMPAIPGAPPGQYQRAASRDGLVVAIDSSQCMTASLQAGAVTLPETVLEFPDKAFHLW